MDPPDERRVRRGPPEPIVPLRLDLDTPPRAVIGSSQLTVPPEVDASISTLALRSSHTLTPPPEVESRPLAWKPGAKLASTGPP